MGKMVEVQQMMDVWVAWSNTDLTEGKGHQFAKAICQLEATAIRLGKKGYVMGSNCPVSKSIAIKINNTWLVPGEIEHPNIGDENEQKRMDAQREAIEKAKKAGLSEEDIKAIGGGV